MMFRGGCCCTLDVSKVSTDFLGAYSVSNNLGSPIGFELGVGIVVVFSTLLEGHDTRGSGSL
jgi:hypothetical protein